MMKKLSVILMLICALTLCFTGCGKGGGGSSSKTTVKLGLWPEDGNATAVEQHQQYIRLYNQRWPDVTIQPAPYFYAVDTIVSLAESRQLPTIFEAWFTEPPKLISNGWVKDITNEIRTLGWDSKMNPGVRDLLSKDGRMYGIPRDAYALGLMLNMDLFRKAGLVESNGIAKYPKTWAELVEVGKTIKQRTGAAGLCLLAKDNAGGWHFSNICWDFGAVLEVQQGSRWVAQLNSPQAVAALQYVKDLKWVHDILTPDPTNEDWGSGFRAIGTGSAAMYIAGGDVWGQPTFINGLPKDDLSQVPLPAGPGGQYFLMGGTIYMFANNATAEEVTAAMHYLEIMGRAPEANPASLEGMRVGTRQAFNDGIPVVRDFPTWTDPAYLKAQQDVRDEYNNVDQRLFDDYFTALTRSGAVKPEEPILAQDLYAELTKCLQAVLTDRNANPQALLNAAQANFQTLLDQEINR
jgi:ABC-type glycerol-3-phosphate transport system substrate-binding protein